MLVETIMFIKEWNFIIRDDNEVVWCKSCNKIHKVYNVESYTDKHIFVCPTCGYEDDARNVLKGYGEYCPFNYSSILDRAEIFKDNKKVVLKLYK